VLNQGVAPDCFVLFPMPKLALRLLGIFVWGGFDVFEIVLFAPVGDLVFLVLLLLGGLVLMGDFDCVGVVVFFRECFGDIEVIFGFLVSSKPFSC